MPDAAAPKAGFGLSMREACHRLAKLSRQDAGLQKNVLRGDAVTKKHHVLFLCRENAARSIMAEALLRELGGGRFEAFSAGADPALRVHHLTLAQLRAGVSDLELLSPKSWHEFTGAWAPRMDLIVAMDSTVVEYHAPAFPGEPEFCEWRFADPLAEGMTAHERACSFESVFWQILRRVNVLIALPQNTLLVSCAARPRECRLPG